MTERLFPDLLDNEVSFSGDSYAAILGLTPSKGARSPLLWNAAFAKMGRTCRMYPFDVQPERLELLVEALRADPRFIGGSCTMPFKQTLLPLLDGLDPEAAKIGAVNCLYRRGGGWGANTDGAGALPALKDVAGSLDGRRALVLGAGGAARAVAVFLAGAGAQVTISNRTQATAEDLAGVLGGQMVGWPPSAEDLANTDILVNCTAVGFENGNGAGLSPLSGETDPEKNREASQTALSTLPNGAVVFDVVYQPPNTPLLEQASAQGLSVLNGLPMNIEQAVIAFCMAVGEEADPATVRTVMQGV